MNPLGFHFTAGVACNFHKFRVGRVVLKANQIAGGVALYNKAVCRQATSKVERVSKRAFNFCAFVIIETSVKQCPMKASRFAKLRGEQKRVAVIALCRQLVRG